MEDVMLNEKFKSGIQNLISIERKVYIDSILDNINNLSNIEKLFLYLKLPGPTGIFNKSSRLASEAENVATNWIRSHLTSDIDSTIPKRNVFLNYKSFCISNKFAQLSMPTFGKLIRRLINKLQFRRLGRKGDHLEYSYGGIKFLKEATTLTLPNINFRDPTFNPSIMDEGDNNIDDINSFNTCNNINDLKSSSICNNINVINSTETSNITTNSGLNNIDDNDNKLKSNIIRNIKSIGDSSTDNKLLYDNSTNVVKCDTNFKSISSFTNYDILNSQNVFKNQNSSCDNSNGGANNNNVLNSRHNSIIDNNDASNSAKDYLDSGEDSFDNTINEIVNDDVKLNNFVITSNSPESEIKLRSHFTESDTPTKMQAKGSTINPSTNGNIIINNIFNGDTIINNLFNEKDNFKNNTKIWDCDAQKLNGKTFNHNTNIEQLNKKNVDSIDESKSISMMKSDGNSTKKESEYSDKLSLDNRISIVSSDRSVVSGTITHLDELSSVFDDIKWDMEVDRSARNIVLEWAQKVMGNEIQFKRYLELAHFLLDKNCIKSTSRDAFILTSSLTESDFPNTIISKEKNCIENLSDCKKNGSTAINSRAKLQLGKTILERGTIRRQKQRMQEERNHNILSNELGQISTKKIKIDPLLTKNLSSKISKNPYTTNLDSNKCNSYRPLNIKFPKIKIDPISTISSMQTKPLILLSPQSYAIQTPQPVFVIAPPIIKNISDDVAPFMPSLNNAVSSDSFMLFNNDLKATYNISGVNQFVNGFKNNASFNFSLNGPKQVASGKVNRQSNVLVENLMRQNGDNKLSVNNDNELGQKLLFINNTQVKSGGNNLNSNALNQRIIFLNNLSTKSAVNSDNRTDLNNFSYNFVDAKNNSVCENITNSNNINITNYIVNDKTNNSNLDVAKNHDANIQSLINNLGNIDYSKLKNNTSLDISADDNIINVNNKNKNSQSRDHTVYKYLTKNLTPMENIINKLSADTRPVAKILLDKRKGSNDLMFEKISKINQTNLMTENVPTMKQNFQLGFNDLSPVGHDNFGFNLNLSNNTHYILQNLRQNIVSTENSEVVQKVKESIISNDFCSDIDKISQIGRSNISKLNQPEELIKLLTNSKPKMNIANGKEISTNRLVPKKLKPINDKSLNISGKRNI